MRAATSLSAADAFGKALGVGAVADEWRLMAEAV